MQHIKHSILAEIQKKREMMIDIAQKSGYTSADTVKCSQELDELIYQYQSFFCKNKFTGKVVESNQLFAFSS